MLFQAIRDFAEQHGLDEFTVADLQPILAHSPSFLSKHRVGNPGGYTPYFIRVARGRYIINPAYL